MFLKAPSNPTIFVYTVGFIYNCQPPYFIMEIGENPEGRLVVEMIPLLPRNQCHISEPRAGAHRLKRENKESQQEGGNGKLVVMGEYSQVR
jgi:hypothetical protein